MQILEKKNCVVYKYILSYLECSLEIPYPAKFLSCKIVDNKICVWFLVEKREKELNLTRNFLCVNTGVPFKARFTSATNFIGTVISSTGIVWHVFMSEGIDNTDLIQ